MKEIWIDVKTGKLLNNDEVSKDDKYIANFFDLSFRDVIEIIQTLNTQMEELSAQVDVLKDELDTADYSHLKVPPAAGEETTMDATLFAPEELELPKQQLGISTPGRKGNDLEISRLGKVKGHKIVKILGRGGTSIVCMASNANGEARVIKFLTDMEKDPTSLKRFFQEIRVSLRLDHPNIARVFGFDKTSNNIWYLVVEYINGINLEQVMCKKGIISPKTAISVAIKVASALRYAWMQNIIHRDLKPANIMVEKGTSAIKLIDFGIGKVMGETNITMPDEVFGTLFYMSPEQLTQTCAVDQRADIYSLGASLYHMISGRPPYWEFRNNQAATIAAIFSHSPQSITNLADVSQEVSILIEKAMARDISERYQTPDELLKDLQILYERMK